MKSAGTQSISMALRSIVVAIFGMVFMFLTSPLLTGLTLAVLPVTLAAFRTCAPWTSPGFKGRVQGLKAWFEAPELDPGF